MWCTTGGTPLSEYMSGGSYSGNFQLNFTATAIDNQFTLLMYNDRWEETNFRGRDKELSAMTSQTVTFHTSYEFLKGGWNFIDRGIVNFTYDFMSIDYKEFRDVRDTSVAPGQEPLYHLDANVFQIFFSFWY